ncbi:MAG TPA: nuclear transport factor 2 family protein [Ilumatobacteraceae bacterium]
MTDDLIARLERLEHIERARAVQACYADIIDQWDIDRLGEVFAGDAVLAASNRRFEGLDAIRGFYRDVHSSDPSRRRHFITNVAVVAANAHEVTLAASFIYVAGTDGESSLGWGRYRDTFRRVGDDVLMTGKDITVGYRGPVSASWGAALLG